MKSINEMYSKNISEISSDEKMLDQYIQNIQKDDIVVPNELEQKINERISTLKRPIRAARYIIAASFLFILAFIVSIRFSPVIASYAAEIPGFATVVDWLRGDRGIRNAQEHGYGGISPITVEQDGFILEITDIFFDEDRLRFSVVAAGPEIAGMLTEKGSTPPAVQDGNKPARAGEEVSLEDRRDNLHLQFDFKDFDNEGYTMTSHEQNSEFLAFSVEKSFDPGEAAAFIKKEPDVINLGLKIKNGDKEVHSFQNIQLAFDASEFKPSTIYNQNRNIVLQHTEIMINSLTISPTRMKLDVSFNMENGYFLTGFENPHLKDEKGNIYKSGDIVWRSNSSDGSTLYFVPSTYFDRQPEKLYFCFDGIRIGSEEGRSFTLSLDEQYPKKLLYMGEEISITQAAWNEGTLIVKFEYLNDNTLRLQGLNIVNNEGAKSSGWDNYSWSPDAQGRKEISKSISEFEVEKRASYDMEFAFPGYLIPSEIETELELKK